MYKPLKISYLENSIEKNIIVKSQKEEIEFYQKVRQEDLTVFKVEIA